jgi:hypothetical protein
VTAGITISTPLSRGTAALADGPDDEIERDPDNIAYIAAWFGLEAASSLQILASMA